METTTQVTNETRIGDMTSYFRWDAENHTHEINMKVNPSQAIELWQRISAPIRHDICDPLTPMTVGKLIYLLAYYDRLVEEKRERLVELEGKAIKAIEAIGSTLLDAAERHEWCEVFDKEVDSMNLYLKELNSDWVLPTREKEYTISIRVDAEVSFMEQVTVIARSEEDACAMIEENVDYYIDLDQAATDHCRFNSFDRVEFEVESVE